MTAAPSTIHRLNRVLIVLALVLTGGAGLVYLGVRAQDKPPVQTGGDPNAEDPWKVIAEALGREGEMNINVYTVTFQRDDLDVQNELGYIPPQAGLKHEFHFYRCDCGKMSVVGQFCVAEYEANDVMDALRATAGFKVASVAPMFMGEQPRILAIRFQGEGGSRPLAETLKGALEWTGEARMAPATRPVENGDEAPMTKPQ